MEDEMLTGVGPNLVPVPRAVWTRRVDEAAAGIGAALGFMTPEHHLVRNFVVIDLPRARKPLTPEYISRKVKLPVARVNAILVELERNLTFLFRNPRGAVAWAYPVTTDRTPHRVTFSTGERIYAA